MANIEVQKTIFDLLQEIRLEMSKAPLKKSGFNKGLGFNYFELADFVPTATKLFAEKGICPLFSITYDSNGIEVAVLKLMKGAEQIVFTCPVERPTNLSGTQSIGALVTYYRRYMYQICLDLVENEIIDASLDNNTRNAKVEEKKATAKQVELIRSLYDEENIRLMLEYYKAPSLEELKMTQASEAIAKKKK